MIRGVICEAKLLGVIREAITRSYLRSKLLLPRQGEPEKSTSKEVLFSTKFALRASEIASL